MCRWLARAERTRCLYTLSGTWPPWYRPHPHRPRRRRPLRRHHRREVLAWQLGQSGTRFKCRPTQREHACSAACIELWGEVRMHGVVTASCMPALVQAAFKIDFLAVHAWRSLAVGALHKTVHSVLLNSHNCTSITRTWPFTTPCTVCWLTLTIAHLSRTHVTDPLAVHFQVQSWGAQPAGAHTRTGTIGAARARALWVGVAVGSQGHDCHLARLLWGHR